jgi:hypothetical protein|tara:strand:+ start:2465 stop:2989 length:525 start_codon:yes stop_codon:yes gene_type:complete
MSYKELQIESVIDDENEVINEETMNFIYQMTELKKKKKIINTPINDIFKDKNMRDIIFGFQKQILQDFKLIKTKVKDTVHNRVYKYMGDLKIGERYYDFERDKGECVFEVIKITAKSVLSLQVKSVIIQGLDRGLDKRTYYKYTDELCTKKQMKRKTTLIDYFKNQDMEIWTEH